MCSQLAAVIRFCGKLVACRKIENQRCAIQALVGAGRYGCPEVFAYLHADFQIRYTVCNKENIIPDRDYLPCIADALGKQVVCPGEPAFFVKFTVIWDKGFWHNAQDLPMVKHDRTVEYAVIRRYGHTDSKQEFQRCRFCGNFRDSSFCGGKKRFLEKQICTAVPGHAKLRQSKNAHAFCCCILCGFQNFLFIINTIGNAQLRNCRADLYITKHVVILLKIYGINR